MIKVSKSIFFSLFVLIVSLYTVNAYGAEEKTEQVVQSIPSLQELARNQVLKNIADGLDNGNAITQLSAILELKGTSFLDDDGFGILEAISIGTSFKEPLFWKVIKENAYEVVSMLIDVGVDVNAKDQFGVTPLVYAAYFSDKIVPVLINAGANVNEKNKDGSTPLMRLYAPWGNKHKVAQMLIDAGAEMNAKDRYGFTPLLCALRRDLQKVVRVLCDNGADIEFSEADLYHCPSAGKNILVQAKIDRSQPVVELRAREREIMLAQDISSQQENMQYRVEQQAQQARKQALLKQALQPTFSISRQLARQTIVFSAMHPLRALPKNQQQKAAGNSILYEID